MEIGKKRLYNTAFEGRSDVILWDVQPVSNRQILKLTFISKDSPYRQGVRLATDKGIEVNSQLCPGVKLWEDTSSREVICKCFTDNGLLSVYNIWDEGRGSQSQMHTSGMLLEERGNLLIYHCNDFGFETNFDKLVFSIEKL